MGNPNQADKLDQSNPDENQEKTVDYFFGVFFDVHEIDSWINAVGNYRNKGKKMKEDFESDIQDNKAYKIAQCVEGTAKKIADALPPNNPVAKALNTKDQVVGYKDKAEGALGKVEGFIDDKASKALDNKFIQVDDEIDPLGSKRSIISLMEPSYVGEINKDDSFGNYACRIYAQGSMTAGDFKQKEPENEENESEPDESAKEEIKKQWSNEAVEEVFKAIEKELKPLQQKLSLHFDIFGYANDSSIDDLKPKINNLKQTFPNINEIGIDYTGKYSNFNDPDEVKGSLGGETLIRFRNSKFLEKNG
jgi:hypothetical protein